MFLADYKELAKPLKKPPHGLEWRRLEDGAWELRSITKALSLLEQQEKDRKRADEDKEEREEGDCSWIFRKSEHKHELHFGGTRGLKPRQSALGKLRAL